MFKTELAYENWKSKYRYKDEEPIDSFRRVAKALSAVEKKEERKEWEEKFLRTIVKFNTENEAVGLKNTTGGRVTANIGTGYKHATLMNCYISGPVSGAKIKYQRKTFDGELSHDITYKSDDNPDDLINIFLTLLEQAKTLASEGGYGINFDFIRPRGALIKGTGIFHPGIVSYMKVWDSVSECIVKGTNDGYFDKLKNYLKEDEIEEAKEAIKAMTRKGAMMGVLPVWHPDIEEFVRAKQTSGVLTKFNISVLIDDKFMEAVKNNDFYDQTFNGKVYKRVKARELYDLIMESTYNRAEPGVIFVDNMNRNNPIAYLGDTNATNPCCRKGTLVATDKGLELIENIKIGDLIQTSLGFEPVENIETHEEHDVYRVYFSDGFSIDVTEGHIFHTQAVGKEARKRWDNETRVSELEEHIGKVFVRKSPYKFKINNKTEDLTRDLGLLAGLFLGDGHIDANNKVCISVDKTEDCVYIEDLCRRLKLPFWFDDSKDSNSRKIVIGGSGRNRSIDILESLGLDVSLKASEKTFPYEWLNTNKQFLCGLLDGLISSDGNVNNKARYPQIRFKSCSKSLHQMVKHLMLFFSADYKLYPSEKAGEKRIILGRTVERKHDCFEGIIDNDSILNVFSSIGFISHPIKNNIFRNIIKSTSLNGVKWKTKITGIEYIGKDTVYDLYAKESDDWNTCGVVSRGCGEIPGLPTLTTVCLLGSVNLTQYVELKKGKPYFDLDQYKADIKIFTRMLDNVNDITYNSLPSYDWATRNIRQFGMGLNGLGSALFMLGIPYNSKKAVSFTKELCDIKENLTWQASAELAKEKGTFPAYVKEKFEKTEYFLSDRLWPETKKMLKKFGARNAKTTTNPPLGNSSIVCDIVSNGIEPVFLLEYERKGIVKGWPEGLTESNIRSTLKYYKENDYEYWRGEYNGVEYYYEPHNRGLCKVDMVRDYGYQWLLDNMPDRDHSKYLITTRDLTIDDHLNIQEAVQYHCNQSVSKTSNLPANYPFKSFKELYVKAWEKGLNGFTTYREGSMESVISDVQKAEESKEIIERDIKLPDEFMNGPTSIIRREGKKFYIHFSYLPEDADMTFPVAMWIYSNNKYKEEGELKVCNKAARNLAKLALKSNVDNAIVQDAIDKSKSDYPHNRLGRLISLCLRHNIPRADVLVSLIGIEGDNVSTLLTAVRKFLSGTLKDGTKLKGLKCESCGSEAVILEGGCKKCIDCGFSGCG